MADQGVAVPDRAEVEYVTRNFSALQGLRILPLAVVFAVWATSEAQLLTGAVWWTLFVASLVGAAVATPLIGRWYARQFGSVEPRRQVSQSTRMALVVIAVVVAAIVVVAIGVSGRLPEVEPVALPGILLGVALAVVAWVQGPVARRVHPWVHRYGAAVAVLSVLPLGMVTGEGHGFVGRSCRWLRWGSVLGQIQPSSQARWAAAWRESAPSLVMALER